MDLLAERTAAWRTRLADETPNGALLRENAMFDALRGGRLHLLHVTTALKEISRQGVLYPSGGCLVGSVYCTPLTPVGDAFRIHNLASCIVAQRASGPPAVNGGPDSAPGLLIVEIAMPPRAYRGLAGVDYLRLGSIHLETYRQLEYLLSGDDRRRLRETVVGRVRSSADFLALATAIAHQGVRGAGDEFLGLLDATIPRLPIVGYLFFEALSEYLMLHSRSRRTRELAEIGEFNNRLCAEVLSVAFPGVTGRFDLTRFRTGLRRLGELLSRVDRTIDADHAGAYLSERVSYLVAARLFAPGRAPADWRGTRWEFDSSTVQLGPLFGHLLRLELRALHRHREVFALFDQQKALQAWRYWNHMGIAVPFNGTMPKGEVGINPAYPALNCRIWRGELDGGGRLHRAEELPLRIGPRLVGTRRG
ncbi:hypothetical protein [Streptomyces jumonjinensis]|uniref:hypothetical protein n=1 Tax=Streptomyces jumonjinensis TaxID=1945 RepID=UPI0037BB2336